MRTPTLAALLPLFVACSDEPVASTPTDGGGQADVSATVDAAPIVDARADAPVVPSGGCGVAKPAGTTAKTLQVNGTARGYQLTIPNGYDGKTPLAVVFAYHGLGGKGADMRTYLDMETIAGAKAIFVYPDGLQAQGGTGWDLAAAGKDIAMFDAVKKELDASYCVDDARIFGVGFSYGGWMANALGCARGDVVRAIAPMSGGGPGGACKGPVATWISHGASDTAELPIEGQKSRDKWITTNGAAKPGKASTPAPCQLFDGGKQPVVYCEFQGGHEIPSFGRQAIWDFFAAR